MTKSATNKQTNTPQQRQNTKKPLYRLSGCSSQVEEQRQGRAWLRTGCPGQEGLCRLECERVRQPPCFHDKTARLFGVELALWPECTARDSHSPCFPYLILEGCRVVVSSAFRAIHPVPQSLLTPSCGPIHSQRLMPLGLLLGLWGGRYSTPESFHSGGPGQQCWTSGMSCFTGSLCKEGS